MILECARQMFYLCPVPQPQACLCSLTALWWDLMLSESFCEYDACMSPYFAVRALPWMHASEEWSLTWQWGSVGYNFDSIPTNVLFVLSLIKSSLTGIKHGMRVPSSSWKVVVFYWEHFRSKLLKETFIRT